MKIIMDYERKQHYIQFSALEIREGLRLDVELFMNIAAYIDVQKAIAKPSQAILAENMGVSQQVVQRRIKKLLEEHPELITRKLKSTKGKIGYMKHSEYHFNVTIEVIQPTKVTNTAYQWTPPTAEELKEQEEYDAKCAEWLLKGLEDKEE